MTAFPKYLRLSLSLLGVWIAGLSHAQVNYVQSWSSYVGDTYTVDAVSALALDSATNVFLGGRLGDGYIQNTDGVEMPTNWHEGAEGFVARVSSSGALEWYACLGQDQDDEIKTVALSSNQTVVAAGTSRQSWSHDGTSAYLASLSATDGAENWSKLIGNITGTNGLTAVATDAGGNIYAVGYTTLSNQAYHVSGYQAGGTTYGLQLKGDLDAFVIKLSPAGNVLWCQYLGGANADRATSCAVTSNGFLYVGGETCSPNWVTLASGTPSPSNPDGFLAKLTTDGTNVWSTFLSGSAGDAVTALTPVPGTAALYVGGRTLSGDFLSSANRLNAHAGATDGFVVKVTDTNTAFRTDWCRFVGSNSLDRVNALALRPDGQLAVGGATVAGGNTNGFFSFLDATGAVTLAQSIGGERFDEVFALAAARDTLFAAGSTFSPYWIVGGFWDAWSKDEEWGGGDFGFVGKWVPGAGTPPGVTSDPSDLTVLQDQPASFTATADGTAPLTYRWLRNGAPVTGLTSNTYVIAKAAVTNNGDTYACLVSNEWGVATSRAATLTVIAKGTLSVALSPAEAVAQGARWSIDGGATWMVSGSTNLPPGAYAVTFTPLSGWLAPAALTDLPLASGAAIATSGVYTAILPSADRAVSGTNVTVTVRAPAGLSTWTLVEYLPAGLTPTNITAGGVWDGTAHTLTFTGAEATTNALAYTVICSTSGIYTVSGTVTPHPSEVPVAIAGDSRIIKANLLRTISGNSVTITVYQPSSSFVWDVTEYMPDGLTPTNMVGPNADWNDVTRELSWYRKGVGVTLSYQVAGAPGTYRLSGSGHVTSNDEPIFGDTALTIPGAEVPSPDILRFIAVTGAGTNTYALTFTSVVNQAYAVLTNATPGDTNGWATCLSPVTGSAGATQCEVPTAGPRLFYRVRAAQ